MRVRFASNSFMRYDYSYVILRDCDLPGDRHFLPPLALSSLQLLDSKRPKMVIKIDT
jgi:hypothetical protein